MGRELTGKNGYDAVNTPVELARAVINKINPTGLVLEPCIGSGNFKLVIEEHGNTCEWCELEKGRDFLLKESSEAEWLITNPPYSKLTDFLVKAMELGIPKLAFLVTINSIWMNGKLNFLRKYSYVLTKIFIVESPYFRRLNNWPQSGFSLGVLVIEKSMKEVFPVENRLVVEELKW